MKAFIGFLTAGFLLINVPSLAASSDYLAGVNLKDGEWLVIASEQSRDGVHSQLALQPSAVGVGETRGDWIQCASADDPTCSSTVALKSIIGHSLLPSCEDSTTEVCVESLKISQLEEDLSLAKYVGEIIQGQEFPGDEKKNLLPGRGVPIYTAANALNSAGTNTYAILVRATQFWNASLNNFEATMLEAEVLPYYMAKPGEGSGACLFRIETDCAKAADFLPGAIVELAFRVPDSLGGWFSGRMKDPTISVAPYSASVNAITVKSEPVEVAALGLVKSKAAFSDLENMWVQNNGRWTSNGGTATGANSWQENIFPFISNYREQVNDTAIGTNLVWKMRTIAAGPGSGCLADKTQVLGIVTTNALGYDIGSPSFDSGFLQYKVAGLHYLPDGTSLALGTYDLVMRSETARCLYGFTKAPISATVQVIGGSENVATTIVSEKDGWLKLAAYGFTFSEKEIQVKLSQPFTKTIAKFSGSTKSLSSKQKAEIKASVTKAKSNPKFICTGTYVKVTSKATALARARAACNYAKSLDKNNSYYAQAKQTKAKSYDAKVMLISK